MPRAFTAVEKETIHERLMQAGRDCFTRYGLKKTTIEDLTGPAGIAKASFYLFFDSKEALYAQIVFEEMPAMMDRIAAASYRKTEDTREALILLMQAVVHEIETNPFSKVIVDQPDELARLAQSVDFEGILEQAQVMFTPIAKWFVEKQKEGEIVSGDPQELIYALGLIKLLPVNRDRIPDSLYDRMYELIPRVIADGLTCPARRRKS
jgi:AcrR family transcriptional regulator